ncbi:MAG: hypothetical protein IJ743_00135 [Bacilli bacterium]|nr:hypothetical protein [Bacilli bacterium]
MMKNEGRERDYFEMNYQESSGYNTMDGCNCMPSCPPSCESVCPPICECPQNQVCHRVMNYRVPHIIPMHTTVVNHHIYNHTYTPMYSYSEVDEVENVYQNRCCR